MINWFVFRNEASPLLTPQGFPWFSFRRYRRGSENTPQAQGSNSENSDTVYLFNCVEKIWPLTYEIIVVIQESLK